MQIKTRLFSLITITLLVFLSPQLAHADHLSISGGLIHLNSPNSTTFEIGGEYEYSLNAFFGVGAQANYIFSNPSVTIIGVPEGFVHPIATDWYISASPIFEFASGYKTQVGARFGTRVPLPIGILTLIPSVAVDFIGGGTNYIFGFGISI